jgi:hypothetical protein
MWFCLKLGADRGCAHIRLMKQHNLPVVIQGLEITSITGTSANWDISADALPDPICPGCGTRSADPGCPGMAQGPGRAVAMPQRPL